MSRQTAFPGILVEKVEASAGASGRTLELEEGLPENIDGERIKSFLSNVRLFGSRLIDSSITYHLTVVAVSETGAKNKARSFVRLKNPFEPDIITIQDVAVMEELGEFDKGRKAYAVAATIQK